MKYNTFLLDADQTIFDFNLSEKNAITDTLKEAGLPYNDKIYEEYHLINKSLWVKYEKGEIERQDIFLNRFKILFKKFNLQTDEDLNEKYFNKLSINAFLLDGAVNFLEFLNKNGKIYLATNGRESIQKSRIELSGISKYLSGVFISEKIGFAKPNIRFFEFIEKSIINFNKQKTVMIGDGISSDILGGNNFGIDTIWLCNTKNDNLEIVPTFQAENYEEIKNYLLSE